MVSTADPGASDRSQTDDARAPRQRREPSAVSPAVASPAAAGFADPEDYDFAILHLSDTQYLAEGAAQGADPARRERYRAALESTGRWMAENARERKIVYVAHTGDVIQNWCWWWNRRATAQREFEAASALFTRLEAVGVPWGVLPGNHDNRWGSDDQADGAAPELTLYNESFGPARSREAASRWAPWAGDPAAGAPAAAARYGGPWRPQDNSCHLDLLEIGETRLVVVHLGYGVEDEHIAWANEALREHADRDAILCTHHYLDWGTRPDGSGALLGGPGSFGPDDGVRIHREVVVPSPNVVLVLSGHTSGTGWRVDRTGTGRPVVAMLADYQAHQVGDGPAAPVGEAQTDDGPSVAAQAGAGAEEENADGERRAGFLRLLQFRVADGRMRVSTYSPHLDSFDPDAHAPQEQLERRREAADAAEPAPAGGWADPHQLELPIALRGAAAPGAVPTAAPSTDPPPPPPVVAGDGTLSPSEDAHGVVRPVRWAPVLIGAGVAAAGALLRGLRRR